MGSMTELGNGQGHYVTFEAHAPDLFRKADELREKIEKTAFTPELNVLANMMTAFLKSTASTFEEKQHERDAELFAVQDELDDERDRHADTQDTLDAKEETWSTTERGYKASIFESEEEIRRLKEELFSNDSAPQTKTSFHTLRATFDQQHEELKEERVMVHAVLEEEMAMQQTTLQALKQALRLLKKEKSSAAQRADRAESTLTEERNWAMKATMEYETIKQDLEDDLNEARELLRRRDSELDTLRARLAQLESELAAEKETGMRHVATIASLEAKVALNGVSTSEEVARLQARLQEVEESALELKTCWQDAEEHCQAESEAKVALSEELADHMRTHADEMELLQAECDTLKMWTAETDAQRQLLEQCVCDCLNVSTKAVQDAEANAKSKMALMQKEQERLRSQSKEFQGLLQEADRKIADLDAALATTTEEKLQLQHKCDELARQLKKHQADLEQATSGLSTRDMTLEEANRHIRRLEEELATVGMQHEQADLAWELERNRLQEALQALQHQLVALEAAKKDLAVDKNKEVARLEDHVKQLTLELEALKAQLKASAAAADASSNDAFGSQARVSELMEQIAVLEATLHETKGLLESAETSAAAQHRSDQTQIEHLGKDIDVMKQHLVSADNKLQAEIQLKQAIANELRAKEEELSAVVAAAAQDEMDRKALERQVCESLRQASGAVRQVQTGAQVVLIQLQGQLDSTTSQVKSLQEHLEKSQAALREANTKCGNLEVSLNATQGELKHKSEELAKSAQAERELGHELELTKSDLKASEGALEAESQQVAQLLEENRQALDEIAQLRAKMDANERAWGELRTKLERELNAATADAQRLAAATTALEAELNETRMAREKEALEWDMAQSRYKTEIDELKAALAAALSGNDTSDIRLRQLQARCEEAESALAQNKRELSSANAKIEELERALEALSSQVQQLTQERAELKQDLREREVEAEEFARRHAATVNSLDAELASTREEVGGYQHQLSLMSAQFESEVAARQGLMDNLTALEGTLSKQVKWSEQLETDRQALEAQVCHVVRQSSTAVHRAETNVQVALIRLQGELDSAQKHNDSLQQQLSTSQATLAASQQQCSTLEQALATAEDEKSRLHAGYEKLSLQVAHLEGQVDSLSRELEALKRAQQQAQLEIEVLTASRDQAVNDHAEATALYARDSKSWASTKAELQRALDSAAAKREQLEASKAALKADLEQDIQEWRAKCEAAEGNVASLTEQLRVATSSLEEARRNIEGKENLIQDLEAELAKLQELLRQANAERLELEQQMSAKLRDTESQLRAIEGELSLLKMSHSMLQESLQSKCDEFEALESEWKAVSEKHRLVTEELQVVTRHRAALEDQVVNTANFAASRVQSSQHAAEATLAELRRQLHDAEARLAQSGESGDTLAARLERALQQIAVLREKEGELQAMLAETEQTLKAWELRCELADQTVEEEREVNGRLQHDLAQLRQKLLQEEGSRIQLEKFIEKTQNSLSPMPYSPSVSKSRPNSPSATPDTPSTPTMRVPKLNFNSGSPSPSPTAVRADVFSPERRRRTPRNKSLPRPSTLGAAVASYEGHGASIMSLCVAVGLPIHGLTSKYAIFTASQDGTARCFDAKGSTCLHTFSGHTATVSAVCVSGNRVFTTAHDGTLRQWDALHGAAMQTFKSVSQHMSGRHLTSVCVVGEWVYFGCRDHEAALQRANIASGECHVVSSGHADGVAALCASHSCVYSGGLDGNVREFDCLQGVPARVFAGHSKEVTSLCYWHRQLFSGSRDATVKHWCLNSGRCLRTYVGHLSVVRTVFADEYALLSGSADGTVRVWNTTTGTCEQMLQQEDAAITALAVEENALYAAYADGTSSKFLIPGALKAQ